MHGSFIRNLLVSLSPSFEFPYSGKCLFICISSTGNEVYGSYPSFMHTCTFNIAFSPCFLLKMVLRYICLKLEHRVTHHTITKKRTKKIDCNIDIELCEDT